MQTLGKSRQAIVGRAKRKGLRKNNRQEPYKNLTEEEIVRIHAEYPKGNLVKLAIDLRISQSTLYQKARAMGVGRDPEILLETCRKLGKKLSQSDNGYRFKPGQVSHNKGKKQTEFMTPEAIARTAKTRFSKGDIPPNVQTIGYERIGKDGYVEVKVRNNSKNENFEFKHRVIYKEHYGTIPKGGVIEFKDGDKYNFDPENLRCVTRRENLLANSISDSCIAKRLFKEKDSEVLKLLISEHYDLIELKRTQILINRAMRDKKENNNGPRRRKKKAEQ